jgi:hypothetical protein
MFPLNKILTYIADEQCALVVGPEIMNFEDKPMNMYVRDRLYEQFKDEVLHYYQNDGLFLFPPNDGSVKSDVAQALRAECHRLTSLEGYREDIFRHIARLPFHLIISINPDTFLRDTFLKYDVAHRFGYYLMGDAPTADVDIPTREEPLIYNMAGSVVRDESLILDYEDLFSFIGSSIGPAGIPGGLRSALKNIRTYIFIGFPFEKWYTHVMLRIVCGSDTYRKYAGPHQINSDIHTFLANQFKIDFWKPEYGDFWTALTGEAEQYVHPLKPDRVFLRELRDKPLTRPVTDIIRAVGNGEYAKALDLLLNLVRGTPEENEAVLCRGRYARIQKEQRQMDSRDYSMELNQIAQTIIELARRAGTPV